MPQVPFIPETITVHLGPPDSNAENVTIPFLDYIANVASSEIYPTWPENAIRANIYAQVSFALNRVHKTKITVVLDILGDNFGRGSLLCGSKHCGNG